MYISSGRSHRSLLNCNKRYLHEIFAEKLTKNSASRAGSRAFQHMPIKHHRIVVIAYVGLLMLDGRHKID